LSSLPSDPLLVDIKELQESLDMALLSLLTLEQEVEDYDTHDPRRVIGLRTLMEAKYDLSKEFCKLAITKAKAGVVGLSWYKENKPPEEPSND